MHSSEYLTAFMGGFEFVLRAFEGRLHATDLDADTQAALEAFVSDYRRVLAEYVAAHREADTYAPLRAEVDFARLPKLN